MKYGEIISEQCVHRSIFKKSVCLLYIVSPSMHQFLLWNKYLVPFGLQLFFLPLHSVTSFSISFPFSQLSLLLCLLFLFSTFYFHSYQMMDNCALLAKKQKKRNVKQMQTLWDILHLGRQWKINQASACKNVRAHKRVCVYVFVYRSHSTTKECAPRFCVSKVRAKNRGMVWTCREKRSEEDESMFGL